MSDLYRLLLGGLMILAVLGCQSSASDAPQFQILLQGDSEILSKEIRVIDNQDALDSLYLQFVNVQGGAPSVDFDANVVLYASAGVQESGGYDLMLESLQARNVEKGSKRSLLVRLKTVVPRQGCVTDDALSSPYLIATIEKSALGAALLAIDEEIEAAPACS